MYVSAWPPEETRRIISKTSVCLDVNKLRKCIAVKVVRIYVDNCAGCCRKYA